MTTERLLLGGVIALLLLAPLPFGAVEPGWSAAIVVSSSLLAVIWIAGRCRRGLPALPWREPALLATAAFAAVAGAQLIPLPPALGAALSPAAASLRAELEPGAAGHVTDPDVATIQPSVERASVNSGQEPTSGGLPEPTGTGSREAAPGAAPDGSDAWRPLSLHTWATRQSLSRFVACSLVALMVLDLAMQSVPRRALAWALVAGGGFQAVYGLAEHLSRRQHIFGYAKQHYAEMATGTFINKNHYAGYLAMCLPVALAMAAGLFPRLHPSEQIPVLQRVAALPGRKVFSAAMVLIVAVVMATALGSSRSRAGMACALAGLLAAGLAAAVSRRRRAFAVAAALAVAVTLLLFFSQSRGSIILDDFRVAPDSMPGQVGRWEMWQQALAMAAAFPVTGTRLGSFQYVFPGFRAEGAGVFLAHAHNDYLEALAETGWAGLIVLAAGVLLVTRSLIRSRLDRDTFGPLGPAALAAVLAIGLHSLVDFDLAIPANAVTFAAACGILIAWRRQGGAADARAPARAAARTSWAVRSLAPAAGMVLVAASAVLPAVAALPEEHVVERASLAGEPDSFMQWHARAWVGRVLDADNSERLFSEAAALGREAVADLQALSEQVTTGGALDEARARKVDALLGEAMRIQEAGISHAPTYPQGHLYRGHLGAALCAARGLRGGDESACVRAGGDDFRTALRLNPMSASTHAKVARFYIRAWPLLDDDGRREALAVIERAAQMNSTDAALKQALVAAKGEVKG